MLKIASLNTRFECRVLVENLRENYKCGIKDGKYNRVASRLNGDSFLGSFFTRLLTKSCTIFPAQVLQSDEKKLLADIITIILHNFAGIFSLVKRRTIGDGQKMVDLAFQQITRFYNIQDSCLESFINRVL